MSPLGVTTPPATFALSFWSHPHWPLSCSSAGYDKTQGEGTKGATCSCFALQGLKGAV